MRRILKITARFLGVIVLLLTALLIISSLATVTSRRIAKTRLDLSCLQMASRNYFQVYAVWPNSIRDLESDANPRKILFVAPAPATKDAWGRPLVYVPFYASLGYGRVLSYGRDGKPGGGGPDRDIEFRFGK
jgi:type II secretory pathway pseudopilin PulG